MLYFFFVLSYAVHFFHIFFHIKSTSKSSRSTLSLHGRTYESFFFQFCFDSRFHYFHYLNYNRKQKEGDYDVVTGTRYAQGGGVRKKKLWKEIMLLVQCSEMCCVVLFVVLCVAFCCVELCCVELCCLVLNMCCVVLCCVVCAFYWKVLYLLIFTFCFLLHTFKSSSYLFWPLTIKFLLTSFIPAFHPSILLTFLPYLLTYSLTLF